MLPEPPAGTAASAPAAAGMPGSGEMLTGLIERITYHNADDSGFCVLVVAVRGRREPVKVVGHAPNVQAGAEIEARGRWEHHRQHGLQFFAERLLICRPSSLEGIERYLGSGLIKGIGPVFARRLVEAFGADIFDVIEHTPERLHDLHGIGERRVERIVKGWADQREIRRIMEFLISHGISTARAVRIFKTYGAEAIDLITANPYRLARDIRGIGFKTADAVALRLGIGPQSEIRARAAIHHVLSEMIGEEGHCAIPGRLLLERVVATLDIPEPIVRQALRQERDAGSIVFDRVDDMVCVFPAGLHRAEGILAERLRTLAAGDVPWPPIDAGAAIAWVERSNGFALGEEQQAAVRSALAAKAMVITGGPGTGKTTLLAAILRILAAKGVAIALAAPTGRAAQRMTQSLAGIALPAAAPAADGGDTAGSGPPAATGGDAAGLAAKTLHRLLEFDPATGGFRRNAETPLACDLLVIDEMSMVDVPMMTAVLKALPDRAALLLVGDIDQLPSVGPGQVLCDIIASGLVPVVRLERVFRQAEESAIVQQAHRIRQGRVPRCERPQPGVRPGVRLLSDFHILPIPDAPPDLPEDERRERLQQLNDLAADRVVNLLRFELRDWFGYDPVRDAQVITPANTTAVGVDPLNLRLQEALNPAAGGLPCVERFGTRFRIGDKVMQTVNNYDKEVWNGDIGTITGIDMNAQEVTITFGGFGGQMAGKQEGNDQTGGGRAAVYDFGELDEIGLAYATTIHKAQGAEYPVVVIPLLVSHWTMLRRNLLYTAITRGRRLVLLVGQERAIRQAVREGAAPRRLGRLRDLLSGTGTI